MLPEEADSQGDINVFTVWFEGLGCRVEHELGYCSFVDELAI